MPEEKIKVLLIDDSGLMRLIISDILRTDAAIEIIDTAENGKDGFEKTVKYKPDVVVTDLVMPHYDGIYAVKNIMKQAPTPIIVLSSLDRADPEVFDALHEGAVDFIDKPKGKLVSGIREVNTLLIKAVKEASKANVQQLRKARKVTTPRQPETGKLNYEIICMGSSTGGPGAIEYILTKLPEKLAVPVVIAQHMPERFLDSFAKRLDSLTALKVKLAEKGEPLTDGTIYLAPGHSNTLVTKDIRTGLPFFSFTTREYKEFNFPSVDCLMYSAAQVYKNKALGVLLTGMGKDGAEGMKAIYEAGGYTLAQDEESSVVYGMPKSVVEIGAARKSIALEDIPAFIVGCL
ncbi:chemotaxis-specific protein-glutamate methyltransferase CheB [Rhodocytophaga aerolata]|uniref:Protein-glutamate methylesterase/protein-glutamine glutaminase n=1 Tax=Rhodocytophaga aerolata TaxID=455078 RepID=A0ABT8R5N2_9BACT|nr:chemotaxis-specific protein-glutamate methyltransferase CheB [Rhodocytophaga aerolata]MDO1446694.1 chemotaxis-specific protein-glutamate methyltransferase CheB [Rhodocytophaga aerolata]